MRIGKKPSLTSVEPCFSQGFASGTKGKSWRPDSGRISLLKERKRKKITSLLLNVEIHFIFFGDIEISQIYVRTSAPAPKPQRKQRKCQISKLLGSFIYH